MYKKLAITGLFAALLYGCVSVPMESEQASNQAKQFAAPTGDTANLYIYRATKAGQALKKDIWLNDECIGESANNVFFLAEIMGNGTQHKISTESEFSPNDLLITADSGKNYFVEQYIKMGAFVGGANLRLVEEEKAKNKIATLKLAKQSNCSKPYPK